MKTFRIKMECDVRAESGQEAVAVVQQYLARQEEGADPAVVIRRLNLDLTEREAPGSGPQDAP